MDLFHYFHFIRPLWFYALIPLFILLLLLNVTQKKYSNWQVVCDKRLLSQLLIHSGKTRSFWLFFLLAVGWLLAVIALAGPSWKKIEEPVYQNTHAKMLVLDLSLAMNATDVQPSRLTRARYKINDLLKQTKDGQIGLLVFANEPYLVSPLTEDAKTIDAMIPNLTTDIMPVGGQDIGRALTLAVKTMQQAGAQSGEIVLISPGPVTERDLEIVAQLKEQGFTTSVLGIGSLQGVPVAREQGNFLQDEKGGILISKLDKKGLQQLASTGNGQYVDFTNNNKDIEKLTKIDLHEQLNMEVKASKQQSERWQDDGRWFVILLLPIALLGFRRGWLG